MTAMEPYNQWIEVDLSAITANYEKVQAILGDIPIMAVVKANAYGHGALSVAKLFQTMEVPYLAVTTLEEGLELRRGGITVPILVFCPMQAWEAPAMAEASLTPTIDDVDALEAFAQAAGEGKWPVAVKVDTGMGRYGVLPERVASLAFTLMEQKNLSLEHLYSHFALPSDAELSKNQLSLLLKAAKEVEALGIHGFKKHIAGSIGAQLMPEARLDMVRIGSLLYGQSVCGETPLNLETTWRFIARITQVREARAGEKIGYGLEYTAKKNMKVGVIPVGYYDGFGVETRARVETVPNAFRQFAREVGKVAAKRRRGVYKGERLLPVLGRIAMQTTVIDLTGLELGVGDTVEVPMRRTTSNPKVVRLYRQKGQLVSAGEVMSSLRQYAEE